MKKNILEENLKKNAIYSIDDSDRKEVDIKEIIEPIQWEVLGEGAHSVVYKIINQNWVVKEGKWIYDFPLSKRIKIPIHTGFAQRLVDNTFLPTKKEIQRQYRLYQTLARYLGYFDEKSEVYHPDLENIFNEQ